MNIFRRFVLVTFAVICAQHANAQVGSSAPLVSGMVSVCNYPAATADAQIASAIAALPKTGGVVDDRCHSGVQTWRASPFAALEHTGRPVTLLLGSGVINVETPGTITVPTSCRIQGISRNGTVFHAGADFPVNTPMFTMGDNNPSYNVVLTQFAISTSGRPGVSAIFNSKSQEKSMVSDISIYDLNGGYGIDIESSGAQNSGPYENLEILVKGGASASTVGIRNRGALTRAMRGITVNASGSTITHGIELAAGAKSLLEDYHCESTVDCVYLDGTAGAVVIGVYGSDSPRTRTTNAVHLTGNNAATTLMNIFKGAQGYANVQDDLNEVTDTSTVGMGWYATGSNKVLFSSNPMLSSYTSTLKFVPVSAAPKCVAAADVGKTALLNNNSPAVFGYCTATNSKGYDFLWAQMNGEYDQTAAAGNVTLDTSVGSLQYVTLAGNSTGSINAGSAGGQQVTIQICNGSQNYSWSWPANVRGGGLVNTGPNRCQSQTFAWNGRMSMWIPTAPITGAY